MAAKAPAQAPEAPKREQPRWRLRWPARLWRAALPLGVALLTLWILPAFTRQWGDRQNAQELKVGLASEIAAATAAMVGPALDDQTTTRPTAGRSRVWLVNRLTIGAKLRAYFDEIYLAQWNVYSDNMLAFVRIAEEIKNINRKAQADGRLPESDLGGLKAMLDGFPHEIGVTAFFLDRFERGESDSLVGLVPSLSKPVLEREEILTRRILAAHPTGFSTTRTDLLRDVVPFWDLKEDPFAES